MAQFAPGHQVTLLEGTAEFFPAMVQAMDAAQHDIRMETYIFDFTASGADVGAALARAALRGVRVQLVVDGVGTGSMPADWRERFGAAGVRCAQAPASGARYRMGPRPWRLVGAAASVSRGRCAGAATESGCRPARSLSLRHRPKTGSAAR